MDVSELERLIGIVNNTNIGELTLRQGHSRLTIRKPVGGGAIGTALVPMPNVERDSGVVSEAYLEEEAEFQSALEIEQTAMITAPSVGYFRHIKPSVGLQARVREGQVVGVIETMKLMIDVTASVSGVVTDVLVEDGMAVGYGHELFVIRVEAIE